MTYYLHNYRSWAQMLVCVLLADEIERLSAWFNTANVNNNELVKM